MVPGTELVTTRRVEAPLASTARRLPRPDAEIGPVHLTGPFVPAPFAPWTGPRAVLRAPADLVDAKGRRLRAEVEVASWSGQTTEVRVRPAVRHPERWGGRRTRRWLELSHAAADALVPALREDAARTAATRAA